MYRKLRNTILAFSVSGAMLVVGLMAAQPLPSLSDCTGAVAPLQAATELAAESGAPEASVTQRPRRSRATHEVIAIPYFSFARGARGSRS